MAFSVGDEKGRHKPQMSLKVNLGRPLRKEKRELFAGKMVVKVSLAETLKIWLSRKEVYSLSCSRFRKMAGVLLKDYFSSTDDMKGYAHTHSDS